MNKISLCDYHNNCFRMCIGGLLVNWLCKEKAKDICVNLIVVRDLKINEV